MKKTKSGKFNINLPLSTGHNIVFSSPENAATVENLMVEIDQFGGKSKYYLYNTPGLKDWVYSGIVGELRMLAILPTFCLAVVKNTLIEISLINKTITTVGTLLTNSGIVSWAENYTQVMIVDGIKGYIYNKTTRTLTQISDPDFPNYAVCVVYAGGYFLVSFTNSDVLYFSSLADGSSWEALNYLSAEIAPDNLVAILSDHEDILAFGTKTVEALYNQGNPELPYVRRPGSTSEIGCGARNSVCKAGNVVFWLDNLGQVRQMEKFSPKIVSTRGIENIISNVSTIETAIGCSGTESGHVCYYLIFPNDNLTFVYDLASEQWHKRNSYPDNGRWRVNCVAQDQTMILAGDFENGWIYELDKNYYLDHEQPKTWICTTDEIHLKSAVVFHDRLILDMEKGVGLPTGQGSDPQVILDYTDDGGKTWSNELWKSSGAEGDYTCRIEWNRLGRSYNRRYRFRGSDPVKTSLISTTLIGELER